MYYGSAIGIDSSKPTILQAGQKEASFGASVANAGDLNNDGFDDIVIGAPYFDNEQEDEGAAFVYLGSQQGIALVPHVQLEGNLAYANMGSAVASAGDVNKDLCKDLIIAASGWQNTETSEGAAFIFHGSPQGVDQSIDATLEGNSEFALTWSVSGAGDVNGDGFDDVVVGLLGYSNVESFEGAATVYYGSPTGINAGLRSLLEMNQQFAAMGVSVAGIGDVNADGFDDIAVGASEFNNGQIGEGVVLVFNGAQGGIKPEPATLLEQDQPNADFGHSVASLRDFNGDGFSDLAVGAYHFDNGETDEGASFIYLGSSQGLQLTSILYESNQSNSQFGISIKNAGDINGDGMEDLIIGAQTFGLTAEGAAFVFHNLMDPLPVRLVNFCAKVIERVVELTWSTSEQVDSDRFEVQRTDSRQQWAPIGQLKSTGDTLGFTRYKFRDVNPLPGANLYRLKMVDKDETYTFSAIINAMIRSDSTQRLYAFPNPASNRIRIRSFGAKAISILAPDGHEVMHLANVKGEIEIDVSTLPANLYSIVATYPDRTTSSYKILIK